MSDPVFKIVTADQWRDAERIGRFTGSPVDVRDGFIHLSAADQVAETAAKHFAGQGDLLLVALDPMTLGSALRWERSRGDALFPHLYDTLDPAAALWVAPLPIDAAGRHDVSGLLGHAQ